MRYIYPDRSPFPATNDDPVSSQDLLLFTRVIDSILAENDLNTVSASRVRKQLQETVGRDLTPHKVSRAYNSRVLYINATCRLLLKN